MRWPLVDALEEVQQRFCGTFLAVALPSPLCFCCDLRLEPMHPDAQPHLAPTLIRC